MHKKGSIFEAAHQVLSEATKQLKVGEMVSLSSIPKTEFVYEFDRKRNKYESAFEQYIDPTDGGGGIGAVGDIFPEKKLSELERSKLVYRDDLGNYTLSYFLPKNKKLLEIAKKLREIYKKKGARTLSDRDAIETLQKEASSYATVFGLVRPTEKYKIIVNDAIWKALPSDVIGTTEYDYSFHAGEGVVSSWLMAIGKSESDVKAKLNKGLAKAKFQYVGNAMALRYSQKSAIGWDY